MSLKDKLHETKLKFQGTKMAPAFNAIHTFLYTPNETTHSGAHVRGADDLKRTMNTVILSLIPVMLFSFFNAGYQHFSAINGSC
jgi:Na+-transporting NADH:ubiquinone oxidoreductase subunit B